MIALRCCIKIKPGGFTVSEVRACGITQHTYDAALSSNHIVTLTKHNSHGMLTLCKSTYQLHCCIVRCVPADGWNASYCSTWNGFNGSTTILVHVSGFEDPSYFTGHTAASLVFLPCLISSVSLYLVCSKRDGNFCFLN